MHTTKASEELDCEGCGAAPASRWTLDDVHLCWACARELARPHRHRPFAQPNWVAWAAARLALVAGAGLTVYVLWWLGR